MLKIRTSYKALYTIENREKVRSPDGDTEYFDIVAGVLKGDTLAPYLFIICLDYMLRTSTDKIRERLRADKEKKLNVPQQKQ